MSQTKRRSTGQRKTGDQSPDRRNGSDGYPAGRRFTPALKSITEGGRVYGGLIAEKRARLGMSQRELAARVHTSIATIERVEEGHPPGAELSKKLNEALIPPPDGPLHRLASTISSVPMPHPTEVARGTVERIPRPSRLPRIPRLSHPRRPSEPRLNLGSRRLWGAVAIVLAVAILVIAGIRLLSADSAPARQPFVKVSSVGGAPASIYRARVAAQKEAAAEARRAAREERAREQAAAAAAAAAAARKAKKAAAAERNSSLTDSQSVSAPVESSPAPSGGGGGSSAPAPEVSHGIGSGSAVSGG